MSFSESEVRSYVGGYNIPMKGGAGRVSLDRPLARIELRPRRLDLRPRGLFKLVIPARWLTFGLIREAFPIAPVFLSGPGLGLTCADGDYYLWTRSADEILDLLEAAGVPVTPAPRRVRPRSLIF